ncbi:hypothetical protein GH714_013950 [Hevea brasiliensis]|uniref:AB hydrolase-1 domain-containing protein n=1 Tax=Hevea brasiliensis TaxID=3981 RepID=A0A6A6LJS6_HEVBR|nr:hypothetical protein GH714_013950 [Hevea brasiliensis]
MDADQDGYAEFAEGRETRYYSATTGIGLGKQNVGEPEMGFQDKVREFLKGAAEMSVQFAKGCRDVVVQSLGREDSFIVRNFGRSSYIGKKVRCGCERICQKLKVFNEYLPEDKDPVHAWSVICIVSVLAFAVLSLSTKHDTSATCIKKVFIHPPSADRILLPDGRYMAYREQGVPADRARFSMIAPHTFLSSRLAGIPGLKTSLLEEFGVYLLTYDLPGFGESDPHPNRNLESSALDMLCLVNVLGVKDKFWVVGYSSGSLHAWAALRYIPDKLAGAVMFAPMVNPYDSLMTKELPVWKARSDRHMALTFIRKRDKALIEDPIYEEFWQRDVEESIRQGNAKPFIEEAVLQVSNWGFSLADIKLQKKKPEKGVLNWLKFVLTRSEEEYTGFLGPIHVWHGMDDTVVPPLTTDFVHRILPGAAVHKLPYEGHFTYFYFCDECHRQIFSTLFGTPQGPINNTIEVDQTTYEDSVKVQEVDQTEEKVDQIPYEDSVKVQEVDQTEEQADQNSISR